MENSRLDFISDHLLSELSLCEKFVRRLFIETAHTATADDPFDRVTYDPSRVAVRTVFCNYIYDAYIRLVIAEKKRYVEQMENAGTLLFLWSIRRAAEMQPDLLRPGQDLATFSKLLNNLRRTSSLDILMIEALQFLDRAARHNRRSSSNDRTVHGVGVDVGSDCDDSLLSLKTRYDPQFESKFFDHSSHYEDAFVPSHRFCNARQSGMNMSRYVGYTMRENIRRLYEYVSEQLDDQVCPCVVLFNFFIRDSYRMYFSKSLRQTSFVTVVKTATPSALDDERKRCVVPISYMIMTNLFPKVGSWFKSINNQLVKKTGKVHIQHLDSFVRMLAQLRYQENEISTLRPISTVSEITPTLADSTTAVSATKVTQLASRNVIVSIGRGRSSALLRKRRRIATKITAGITDGSATAPSDNLSVSRVKKRKGSEKRDTDNNAADNGGNGAGCNGKFRRTKNESAVRIDPIATSVKSSSHVGGTVMHPSGPSRVSLSSLYQATDDDALFADMFSTRFRACTHAHVVRTYEQMRANDESATLVRMCLDCGNRL